MDICKAGLILLKMGQKVPTESKEPICLRFSFQSAPGGANRGLSYHKVHLECNGRSLAAAAVVVGEEGSEQVCGLVEPPLLSEVCGCGVGVDDCACCSSFIFSMIQSKGFSEVSVESQRTLFLIRLLCL